MLLGDDCWAPSTVCSNFPGGSVVKNPPDNTEDTGSSPVSGTCPGGGDGNPLQYSCPKNFHGQTSLASYYPWSHKELDTIEHTHVCTHTHTHTRRAAPKDRNTSHLSGTLRAKHRAVTASHVLTSFILTNNPVRKVQLSPFFFF